MYKLTVLFKHKIATGEISMKVRGDQIPTARGNRPIRVGKRSGTMITTNRLIECFSFQKSSALDGWVDGCLCGCKNHSKDCYPSLKKIV